MVSLILTWLIIAWGALACIYMLRCGWSRFPKRDVDVDDVVPFLYPVDISLAESLLDPAAEFEFRWKLSRLEFREAQRKSALQQKAIEVRLYSLMTRIRLRFWLLFRSDILNSMPVLSHLRTAGDIDGLQTYTALKTAAAAAFVQLQPEELDSLTRSL